MKPCLIHSNSNNESALSYSSAISAVLTLTCPYPMGEAVFKARDMYAMMRLGIDYDDMEICNGQGVYKGGLSPYQQENALLNQSTTGLKDSIDYLSIYPNPVRDELFISHLYSTNLKATFRLFDLSSKKCYEKQIEKDLLLIKLQLGEIAPGMYLYEYVIENGVSYRGKLLVE
jgi:hypothetical protein